jgi:hypothetical protein
MRQCVQASPPRREVAAVVALQQVVLCLASDPASLEVHGGSVLHQDPALLPKVLLRQMQQDAIEDGGPDASIDEYVTFCFLFAHEDRADLYIGGDPTCVRKQIDGFPTLAAACGFAQEWVGSSATERDFHHMPGIYQTAFVKFTNGYQADLDPLEMAWYLPSPSQEDLMLVRDFPPRLQPSQITPEPGRASWRMMPRAAVRDTYRQRGVLAAR